MSRANTNFLTTCANISRGPDGPSLLPILISNIVCHSIIYEVHSSTGMSQHIYPRNPFFLSEQTTAVKLVIVNDLAYRGPLFTADISVISHVYLSFFPAC